MVSKYKYKLPFMQKIVGNYLSLNPSYKEAMLEVWDVIVKVMLKSSISSKMETKTM
jgi:hypothetical protein